MSLDGWHERVLAAGRGVTPFCAARGEAAAPHRWIGEGVIPERYATGKSCWRCRDCDAVLFVESGTVPDGHVCAHDFATAAERQTQTIRSCTKCQGVEVDGFMRGERVMLTDEALAASEPPLQLTRPGEQFEIVDFYDGSELRLSLKVVDAPEFFIALTTHCRRVSFRDGERIRTPEGNGVVESYSHTTENRMPWVRVRLDDDRELGARTTSFPARSCRPLRVGPIEARWIGGNWPRIIETSFRLADGLREGGEAIDRAEASWRYRAIARGDLPKPPEPEPLRPKRRLKL